MLTERIGS